jgi:hypothetical protein
MLAIRAAKVAIDHALSPFATPAAIIKATLSQMATAVTTSWNLSPKAAPTSVLRRAIDIIVQFFLLLKVPPKCKLTDNPNAKALRRAYFGKVLQGIKH